MESVNPEWSWLGYSYEFVPVHGWSTCRFTVLKRQQLHNLSNVKASDFFSLIDLFDFNQKITTFFDSMGVTADQFYTAHRRIPNHFSEMVESVYNHYVTHPDWSFEDDLNDIKATPDLKFAFLIANISDEEDIAIARKMTYKKFFEYVDMKAGIEVIRRVHSGDLDEEIVYAMAG